MKYELVFFQNLSNGGNAKLEKVWELEKVLPRGTLSIIDKYFQDSKVCCKYQSTFVY